MPRNSINLKINTMKTYKRTANQKKILEGMDKVYEKLIEFKRKMNSEIVVLNGDEIVRIKP
jgi:ADP-glucose pyrophosphorylase